MQVKYMSSLFFWFVYFTIDDVKKVKAVFMSPVSQYFILKQTVNLGMLEAPFISPFLN